MMITTAQAAAKVAQEAVTKQTTQKNGRTTKAAVAVKGRSSNSNSSNNDKNAFLVGTGKDDDFVRSDIFLEKRAIETGIRRDGTDEDCVMKSARDHERVFNASVVSFLAAAAIAITSNATAFVDHALAIPQTSECATNACDDFNYEGKDLRETYFTKGSLKRANFRNANLSGISLFGANLEDADFTGANLENANLGQCNLMRTNFTGANLTNAIVSGASNLDTVKANDSDWSLVIIRKDVLAGICANVDGVSPVSGDPTAMTLECP